MLFRSKSTGEIGDKKRMAETQTAEFMEPLLEDDEFKEYVRDRYAIAYGSIMGESPVLEETEDA